MSKSTQSELKQVKMNKVRLTARHVRSARALLDWTLEELAVHCGVSRKTIMMWENKQHRPTEPTQERIRGAFEKAGVEFLNGGSPGVRLHGDHNEDD
jgi:transcriptional regulator with XRE-family HTH domain